MAGTDRAHVHAGVGRDGATTLTTNLREFDRCELPSLFGALAAHLDLDAEEMRKAVSPKGGETPDPRFPALLTLIAAARSDWDRFGAQLVEGVADLLEAGKLLPMTAANEGLLQELFRDHAVKIAARFAGRVEDRERLRRLVDAGLVADPTTHPSLLEVSYRLGRGLDMMRLHLLGDPEAPPLERVVRQALEVPLTPRDRLAMGYAQRRGEVFMRRPIEQAQAGVSRALTLAELTAFRAETARAVRNRKTPQELAQALRAAAAAVSGHPDADRRAVAELGAKAVAPEVRAAMASRTLQNDFDRVARTELAFAKCHGSYEALRVQAAEAGHADPQVYKMASPDACTECRRIWGHPSNPVVYRLSVIEAWEAQGGNFGRPHHEWRAQIGPIHPNCTEAGLQFWEPKMAAAIHGMADELLKRWGAR